MKSFNYLLKLFRRELIALSVIPIILLGSCTVTNNLYVNDPVPLEKNRYSGWGGIGMGLTPSIDSVSSEGEVFSKDLGRTYNLCLGGKYGFSDRFNVAATLHFPKIIGGFGSSVLPQYSFFQKKTIFNAAIACDLGFVVPKDSIKIFGSTSPLEVKTKGAIHADFAFPVSIKFGKDIRLIVTPRYSFNAMYLRKNFDSDKSKRISVNYPAISLGFRLKKVLLESSLIQWNNKQMYMFGVVFLFDDNKEFKQAIPANGIITYPDNSKPNH